MSVPASIYDSTAVETVRRDLRIDPQAIRKLKIALCKRLAGPAVALQQLPATVRNEFSRRVRLRHLRLERRLDSHIDGATKLVLLTDAGQRIEAVLLRADSGRVALCLSSQVGCAANCDFCATGKMGLLANLSAAEMLDQVVIAGEQLAPEGRKVRNIVMMGMGEPFHNCQAVHEAVDGLLAADLFHHPPTRLLISTVGIPDAMLQFVRRYPSVNVALSLHSVRQDVREQIIPLARRYRIEQLRATLSHMQQVTSRSIMLEYLMLADLNDSLEDAQELANWSRGLNVHLNLIPFNPIDDAPHLVGSDRDTRDTFAMVLKRAGIPTTMRYSMGADIEAACGQLVQRIASEGARVPAV